MTERSRYAPLYQPQDLRLRSDVSHCRLLTVVRLFVSELEEYLGEKED